MSRSLKPRRFVLLVLVLALALSAVAVAATVQELTATADLLLHACEELELDVVGCPGGHCAEAAQLIETYEDLEAERLDLHDERDLLDPCSNCSTLDGLIAAIDDVADSIGRTQGEWDENP